MIASNSLFYCALGREAVMDKGLVEKVKLAVSSILALGLSIVIALLLVTGLTPAVVSQADAQFYSLLDYISPPWNTDLDADFFSREDVLHMQDVRNVYKVLWGSLIVLGPLLVWAWLKKRRKQDTFAKPREEPVKQSNVKMFASFAIAAAILTLLLILILNNWQALFVAFHKLLFPGNTYWLLDPSSSNLIKYFPDGVFQLLFLATLVLALTVFLSLTRISRVNKVVKSSVA